MKKQILMVCAACAGAGFAGEVKNPEWEDLAVNSINRLPARTYAMPLADEWAALLNNTAYGNDSLENARLHLGTLDPNDHYTATVTKPTCTAQGYTTYTCPCGNSYKDDYADALGHDYGKGGVCTRCGTRSGNIKAPSFASRLLDSIRSIFESLFNWLPFC